MSSSEDDILRAAQISVLYLTLYCVTFVNTLATKRRLLKQASLAKMTFNRYTSPQMHSADRLVGNFTEWSPVFLGLMWSLAATNNLTQSSAAMAAWTYLGLRGLYIVLQLKYGLSPDGVNKMLWISTFPSYLCLLFMWIQALHLLLF